MTAEEFLKQQDMNPKRKYYLYGDVVKLAEMYHKYKSEEVEEVVEEPDCYTCKYYEKWWWQEPCKSCIVTSYPNENKWEAEQ